MTPALLGITGLFLLFVLIFLNVPVGFAMAGIGMIGVCLIRGFDGGLATIGLEYYRTASTYVFSVIPLFIAMGFLAQRSQLSEGAFKVIRNFIGHMRGGLAMATTVSAAIFSAICGDSIATAITIGSVSLPEMRKSKYSDTLSLGCIAAGGNLGFLIPPSLGFIFYAILTEQSVGTLFISGIVPGILLTVLFIVTIWIWCRIYPESGTASEKVSWKVRLSSLKDIFFPAFIIVLILGGIYAGFFTPTEAGAVGVFGIVLAALIKRRLTIRDFSAAMFDTGKLVGRVFILVTGAVVFSRFITLTELPYNLAETVVAFKLSPYVILCIVLLFYILIGFVMDIMSIILLAVPILHPILVAVGFDPVWLAALTMVTILMGNISPPVGIVVYGLRSFVEDVSILVIFRGVMPFLLAMIIGLILMIIFPQISLFLPQMMH
jgi:tripartite ATP-independent transporter DctM subunit